MRTSIGRFAAVVALIGGGSALGVGLLNVPTSGASNPIVFTVNDAGDFPLSPTATAGTCESTDNIQEADDQVVPTCTLRAAIAAAATVDSDVTIDVPDPTMFADGLSAPAYILNGVNTEEVPLGQLNIAANGTNTVTIVGAGANVVTVEASATPPGNDGDANFRDLKVDTDALADISGITFQYGDPSGDVGGGILNCGTLTLSDSVLTDNLAADTGGGIQQSSGGSTTLTDDTISDNSTTSDGSDQGGGGVYVEVAESEGTMAISGSLIAGNTAGQDGGGVLMAEEGDSGNIITISDTTISGNSAPDNGGGLAQDALSNLSITNSTIENNNPLPTDEVKTQAHTIGQILSENGGGLYLGGESATDTISNDLITENEAVHGGGVLTDEAEATFTADSVDSNTATDQGGGLDVINDAGNPITVTGSTISNNVATGTDGGEQSGDGGGILAQNNDQETCSDITMVNDTIADNTAADDGGGYADVNCFPGRQEDVRPAVVPHADVAPIVGTLDNGNTSFLFDTLSGNEAADTDGGANIELNGEPSIDMANTIVSAAGNADGSTTNCAYANDAAPVTSDGYNLTDDTSCFDPALGTDLTGTNPDLADLALSGGPTVGDPTDESSTTLATDIPAADSPAVGAIPAADCEGVTTDELNAVRPSGDGGTTCSIGAVELSSAAVTPPPVTPPPVAPPSYNPNGYRMAAADGGAFDFGIQFGGSLANLHLNAPIVGLANEPGPEGYLMVASDGGVFSFGGASYFGSLGGKDLASPIAAIATTPDGGGYWLVSRAGQTFNFGDAPAIGSAKSTAPIVGIATSPDGKGAWLVASDGGVFALGDAIYEGSLGGKHLNAPIVGIAPSNDGLGYLLVASDGGVFALGDAVFHGSTASLHLNAPIVGIAETNDDGGYWLVGTDGGVFAFGDAPFLGSMGGIKLNAPIVGIQHLGQGPQSG